MESPWFSVAVKIFCLLTLGNIVAGNAAENSTDIHEEPADEVPDPTMMADKEVSDYRVPGYYAFNNGEPFYLEKDPLTGAIDFNKKAAGSYPNSQEYSSSASSKQDRVAAQEKADVTESDYYEDDDVGTTDQDFKEDPIDRKDGNVDGYRPNDIDKNPFKISADLHQFLNLPVHYSSSDKFPLISSSYANTKIQGTGSSSSSSSSSSSGSGYSNHKYASTSSTQAPSYYTFKQSTTKPTEYFSIASSTPPPLPSMFTTVRPKPINTVSILTSKPAASSSTTTATTPTSTVSTTTSTTPKSPYSEYNEGEDLVYSDYDMDYGQPQNSHSQIYPAVISTTTKSSTHVFKPTVIPVVDDYPIRVFKQNATEPEEEDFEEDVSIVTSLPMDVYYSQQQSSTPRVTSTSAAQTTTYRPTVMTTTEEVTEVTKSTPQVTSRSPVTSESSPSPVTTKLPATYSEMYKPTPTNNNYHFFGTKDNFEPIVDEPFRPIFGPHDSSTSLVTHKPQSTHSELMPTSTTHIKPYLEYHSPSNAKPLPNHGKIEFVERVPSDDHLNKLTHKPSNSGKHPGSEPPRPNPPISYPSHNSGFNEHSSGHFVKQPIQNNPLQYNNDKPVVNGNISPIRVPPQHDAGNRVRPQNNNQSPSGVLHSPVLPDGGSPIRSPQQNQRPPFIRLPDDVPFYVKKHSNGSVVKITQPEEIIYPHQRPVGVVPPTGLKPEAKPTNQVVKFHPPMKHDNHYIKVPIDEENPSYSLQTSFSIGLPGDSLGDKENSKKPGQGVGQVLFPDGSIDTSVLGDKDKNIRPPVIRNRPPNTRPYITSYNQVDHPQQTRPQLSPSISSQIIPQRPSSPQRHPVPELRPPKPITESYPRPHWENRPKPHVHFNPQHGPGPKPDLSSPYSPVHRVKSDSNVQRPDLPNILPQFRPNAKVGSNEFSSNVANSERMREPMDILQPPPLPQPQHLRINRNDDSGLLEEEEPQKALEQNDSTQSPVVHRRASSQSANRVTTLQMMQQGPPRRNLIKTDYHDNRPDKPVYLVYPANAGSKQQMQNEAGDGVVVVGTRGTHQPVPPSNLKTTSLEKDDEDLDPFPLDDEKQFSIPTRDRVDTPILKTKPSNKPALKNDFPYEILKPQENIVVEERIISGSSTTKEYNAFSPTASSSTEDIKDPDSEINLIPYLQDYMPFATKKPGPSKTGSIISQLLNGDKNPDFIKLPSTNKPISVTLNTKLGTTWKPDVSTDYPKSSKPALPTSPHESVPFNLPFDGKSTHTVSAVMQTSYAKKPVNHRPYDPSASTSSVQPKPLDLEAPFQASLSAPESQGWTVVKSNAEKQKQEPDKRNSETSEEKKPVEPTETKFDFDNFKPELFGGFRPIVLSAEEKTDSKSEESTSGQNKKLSSERQEKTYR